MDSGGMTLFACLFVPVVLLIVILVMQGNAQQRQRQQMAAAKSRYDQHLTMLKANPTDADLKQKTLQLGREYSNLTRDKKGVTLFDEMALKNDIDAATAGAVLQAVPAAPVSLSIQERFAQLEALKAQGVVTEDEYARRRAAIVDSL